MPHAFTISSEMRTALTVGESGALSGSRAVLTGGAVAVPTVSGVFGGGLSPPQASVVAPPSATAARTMASEMTFDMIPPIEGTTDEEGLIFQITSGAPA